MHEDVTIEVTADVAEAIKRNTTLYAAHQRPGGGRPESKHPGKSGP